MLTRPTSLDMSPSFVPEFPRVSPSFRLSPSFPSFQSPGHSSREIARRAPSFSDTRRDIPLFPRISCITVNTMNQLYYGDNLDVLRRHIKDESVHLVYLDPPFNSNQDYNVLFKEKDGTDAASQFKAFEDTWEWNQASAEMYEEIVERGGRVSDVMQAFRRFLGTNDMLAYLTMMAPRLVELQRVLKPTGSIYLHCDPTASHYLKLLMDAIFSPQNFRSEVSWKRTSAHSGSKRWGPVHDTLLFYSKSDSYIWNEVFQSYSEEYVDSFYRFTDEKGRFRIGDLTGAGTRTARFERPTIWSPGRAGNRVWR